MPTADSSAGLGWSASLQADRQISELADEGLIELGQSGSVEAIGLLYDRYFDRLHNYARTALGPDEAEDVAQQVFIQVIDKLPGFKVDPKRPFRAWLFTIARNQVVDARRKRKWLRLEDPVRIEIAAGASDTGPRPSLLAWLSDAELACFVDRLPDAQREVIVLRYLLDLTFEEVAQVLGRSPAAVYKLHGRALLTLKARLESVAAGREVVRSPQQPQQTRRGGLKVRPALAS